MVSLTDRGNEVSDLLGGRCCGLGAREEEWELADRDVLDDIYVLKASPGVIELLGYQSEIALIYNQGGAIG